MKNKKIIKILIGILVLLILFLIIGGVLLYSQGTDTPEDTPEECMQKCVDKKIQTPEKCAAECGIVKKVVNENSKCGDGVCDKVELRNLNLCPQDCGVGQEDIQIQQNIQTQQDILFTSDFSPSFGVHPSSMGGYFYAKDLGIDFNREGNYFIWDWSDINKNGNFKFKKATAPAHPDKPNSGGIINYDNEQEKLSGVIDITIMRNVCPFRGGTGLKTGLRGEFENTEEQEIYQEYVEKLVERYDGDSDLGCVLDAPDCYNAGDDEYPSQSLINTLQSNPINYWQTCNQVFDTCSGDDCKINNNYAEKYAQVQELTYLGVKASCPECQVLIAGDSGKDEYPPVYEALNGKYIDIIDKHFFGEAKDYVKIQGEMNYLKNSLRNSGFDLAKLKFWITETGTYSGAPVDDRDVPENLKKSLPYQSESQQAQGLIKRYAVAFGEGIEKVLWAWGIEEGFGCDCCIFDYTGFIYDGNKEPQTCDINDPYDLGAGVKKLTYYSFKLMVDKIGGFTSVETIENSNNYVYKFIKNGKPVWVAWNDDSASQTLTLNVGNLDSVKITESVPKYETGKEVTNYDSAFDISTKDADNGIVSITLGETPVFVEEI